MSRTQFAVMLVVVGVAGLLGGALSDSMRGRLAVAQELVPDVIKAREFQVVDKDGDVRISLAVAPPKPVDRPLMLIWDKSGANRVHLGMGQDGQPYLALADQEDMPRARLQLVGNGDPSLSFTDKDGRAIWSAP